MVLIWGALTLVAPSFAWCAVPVAFAVLRISDSVDPTLIVGPIGMALVTVLAYRALERESQTRLSLLQELTDAQEELADEQRRSGAFAERSRLSREIHDSVGQGLSSINLFLNAADQEWDRNPDAARGHVVTAASTARGGLDEVRRVVGDLAPDPGGMALSAAGLADALRQDAYQAAPDLAAEIAVHGEPVPLPPQVATALVHTTRGALANVREHAHARRVVVTLTYLTDEVLLDIRDDGRGFAPVRAEAASPQGLRGHGLNGIRERAAALGGRADVESAVDEGTTVSMRIPLAAR